MCKWVIKDVDVDSPQGGEHGRLGSRTDLLCLHSWPSLLPRGRGLLQPTEKAWASLLSFWGSLGSHKVMVTDSGPGLIPALPPSSHVTLGTGLLGLSWCICETEINQRTRGGQVGGAEGRAWHGWVPGHDCPSTLSPASGQPCWWLWWAYVGPGHSPSALPPGLEEHQRAYSKDAWQRPWGQKSQGHLRLNCQTCEKILTSQSSPWHVLSYPTFPSICQRTRGARKDPDALGEDSPRSASSDVSPCGQVTLKSTLKGGFPGGPVVKNLPADAEDTGSVPGPGRLHM